MYSIKFPNMFSSTEVQLAQDNEATRQNLTLILGSEKRELFGDPYFGANLKKLLYNQNDQILQNIIIDNIYTTILIFMPQILIRRRDIKIVQKKTELYAEINCYNSLTAENNLYSILLTEAENI